MRPLLIVFFLFRTLSSIGQWQQTEGPVSNIGISDIFSDDFVLLAGAPCGTFLSADDGNEWLPVSYETFNTSVIFKDTLYLGGDNIRKIISVSKNWIESYSLYKRGKIFDLYSDAQTIYAALEKSGLNYSLDGKKWTSFNDGLPEDYNNIPHNPGYYTHDVFAVTGNDNYIFAGTRTGVFRSEKAVLGWTALSSNPDIKKVNALLCKGSMLILASENKIYRSENNGDSWLLSYSFSSGNTINKLRSINDTLFALSSQEGILLSVDDGITWISSNNALSELAVFSITSHNNEFFLADATGVYRNIKHWEKSSQHIICSDIIDIQGSDLSLAAVDFKNVFISTNRGVSWTNSTDSLQIRNLRSVVKMSNSFFFSANGTGYGQLSSNNYLSSDNGVSWENRTSLNFYDDPYLLRNSGDKVIAVEDDQVFLSEDLGSSWKNISPPPGMVCNNFNDFVFEGDTIYLAACGPAEILKSIDYGKNWKLMSKGLPESEVYKMGECRGVKFAATYKNLYRLMPGLDYWEICGKGLPPYNYDLSSTIVDFDANNQYFFLCTSDNIYASGDQGYFWSDISDGLPALPNNKWAGSVLANDSVLYYGTNNYGIWKRNISDLVLVIDSSKKIENIVENDIVFPNPAIAMIYFKMPQNEFVSQVDFFDGSGRILQSRTIQENKINIQNLPIGLIILRIQTNTGQMIHVKLMKIN